MHTLDKYYLAYNVQYRIVGQRKITPASLPSLPAYIALPQLLTSP